MRWIRITDTMFRRREWYRISQSWRNSTSMAFVPAIIRMTISGMTCVTSMAFTWLLRQMSNRTVWVMAKKHWRRTRCLPKHIWNVISAMSSVTSIILQSYSGRWVMKPVLVRTLKPAINGLRMKTNRVPFSMNKPVRVSSQTFIVRCIWIMKDAQNIVRVIILTNRLYSVNMRMPWAILKADSRNTGILSVNIRSIRADLSGTLLTSHRE